MNNVPTRSAACHFLTALDANSGPLSLRIHSVGETSETILVTAIHCRNAADVPLAKPDVAVTGRTVVACVQLAVGPREVTIDLDRNTCTVRPAAPQPAATE